MKRKTSLSLFVASLALSLGCEPPRSKPLVKSARLGVFFGGQIEERREIPFELDPTKQSQGFRVDFSEPLLSETEVEWRVDMPRTTAPRRRASPHEAPTPEALFATTSGKDVARAGQTELDHVLSMHPGDPLGLWNVRVVVRGKVAIDRAIEVYDAALRERLTPNDGG